MNNDYTGPDRGLGDTVSRVIKTLTGGKINPCKECTDRRDKLNKLMPYKQESEQPHD